MVKRWNNCYNRCFGQLNLYYRKIACYLIYSDRNKTFMCALKRKVKPLMRALYLKLSLEKLFFFLAKRWLNCYLLGFALNQLKIKRLFFDSFIIVFQICCTKCFNCFNSNTDDLSVASSQKSSFNGWVYSLIFIVTLNKAYTYKKKNFKNFQSPKSWKKWFFIPGFKWG